MPSKKKSVVLTKGTAWTVPQDFDPKTATFEVYEPAATAHKKPTPKDIQDALHNSIEGLIKNSGPSPYSADGVKKIIEDVWQQHFKHMSPGIEQAFIDSVSNLPAPLPGGHTDTLYMPGQQAGKTETMDALGKALKYPTDKTFKILKAKPKGESLSFDVNFDFGKEAVTEPTIKNNPDDYVKNPAFDKEFQAQVKLEKLKQAKADLAACKNDQEVDAWLKKAADQMLLQKSQYALANGVVFNQPMVIGYETVYGIDGTAAKGAPIYGYVDQHGNTVPMSQQSNFITENDMALSFTNKKKPAAHPIQNQVPPQLAPGDFVQTGLTVHMHTGGVSEGATQAPDAGVDTNHGYVTEEASSEVLQLVDEYTALQAQIDDADISHLLKAQEGLKKSLQSIAKSDNYPSHKPVRLFGTTGNYVEFSAQNNTQKITDKDGLLQAITLPVYIQNTDITLGAAKKLLTESELEKFTTITPGARTLKNVHYDK